MYLLIVVSIPYRYPKIVAVCLQGHKKKLVSIPYRYPKILNGIPLQKDSRQRFNSL